MKHIKPATRRLPVPAVELEMVCEACMGDKTRKGFSEGIAETLCTLKRDCP